MSIFDKRKAAILADLQSEDPDLSPKGRPDDEIIELLALLNSHPDFVSTSSCSGRAVVFLDADKTSSDEASRGRWLMNRHTPLDNGIERLNLEQLNAILFADCEVAGQGTLTEGPRRFVTLKFEPLVYRRPIRS
jgi:tRNA wybutosine-synthesizing protein 3